MPLSWLHRIPLADPPATARCGMQLAAVLQPGDIVALQGELGAGKTTLARAVIHNLMAAATPVPSPTFTLLQQYATPRGTVWHFDLYRIKHAEEIHELGWDDALADGIMLVEWPEHAGGYLSETALQCRLSATPEGGRMATLCGDDVWASRLRGIF